VRGRSTRHRLSPVAACLTCRQAAAALCDVSILHLSKNGYYVHSCYETWQTASKINYPETPAHGSASGHDQQTAATAHHLGTENKIHGFHGTESSTKNRHSAIRGIPWFYGTQIYIIVFTESYNWKHSACMYLCMYVRIHVYMHLCMYVRTYACLYIHVRIYVYMYVCMYVYICMYVRMYIYVCMYAYICMYVYVRVYVGICMCACKYVCMYACMYVYTYLCMQMGWRVRLSAQQTSTIFCASPFNQSASNAAQNLTWQDLVKYFPRQRNHVSTKGSQSHKTCEAVLVTR
jgi:hypothetical protein